MKITPIITENWKMDGGVAFGVIPRTLWSKVYPPDEQNLIQMCNRCLLVETKDRLVLIDVGFGNKRNQKYYQYKYISEQIGIVNAVENAGYNVNDVSDVIFTHLHDDHCGGAVKKNDDESFSILFKNAQHWISQKQWDSAMKPNSREAASYFNDNVISLKEAGLIQLVKEEAEIIPGIFALLFDGHSSGQLLPVIHAQEKTYVYTSDLIPSLAHVSPVWIASVDIEPILALQEKEAFLRMAKDKNYTLIFEHDSVHTACVIRENIKGFYGEETEIPSDNS